MSNRIKKSFAAPTAKPCDVEYRLRRLRERVLDVGMFLRSIDPVVFPEAHKKMSDAFDVIFTTVNGVKAPAKKARRSAEEKAQASAAKQLAKEQAAAARVANKAAKTPVKATKAKPAPMQVAAAAAAGTPGSAIERALAAARARNAVRMGAKA